PAVVKRLFHEPSLLTPAIVGAADRVGPLRTPARVAVVILARIAHETTASPHADPPGAQRRQPAHRGSPPPDRNRCSRTASSGFTSASTSMASSPYCSATICPCSRSAA